MDLKEAKQKLYDTNFLIKGFRHSKAIEYLEATDEIEAMDILAEALVKIKNKRKVKKISKILSSITEPAKIDRLWLVWSTEKNLRLGEILKTNQMLVADGKTRILCLLKLGRVEAIGLERPTVISVSKLSGFDDADVKESIAGYEKKLQSFSQDGYLAFLLLSKQYDKIGKDRKAVESILPYLKDHYSSVSEQAEKYLCRLPESMQDFAALKTGDVSRLEFNRDKIWEVAPYFDDKDPDVVAGAEKYLDSVKKEKPNLAILFLLKIGREKELGTDIRHLREISGFLDDVDDDVRQAVNRYFHFLPDRPDINEEIYNIWIRTESKDLLEVIKEKKRQPIAPEKEALFCLVAGRVEQYHNLEDKDGVLFQQAYIMASESFRKRINETVVRTADNVLTEKYRKALLHRGDIDPEVYYETLKQANDEEGLFEAAGKMDIMGLLDLCERWDHSDWRPKNVRRRDIVETAVKAFKKVGQLTFETDAKLPSGLTDLFTFWENQNPGDKDLREGLSSKDPFIQARSIYMGHRKGLMDDSTINGLEKGGDWPIRMVGKMLFPEKLNPEDKDHVQWLNLLTGIDAEILSAKVACTPDVYKRHTMMLKERGAGGDKISARRWALLTILHSFQTEWVGSAITLEDDDSAEELGAIEVEDIDAADLQF
ncbi:MAG: hypothetical protein JW786_02515 [Desulfobacterales bacterium]|nr:hypothetical protein [Desulfobacterales bacterium]